LGIHGTSAAIFITRVAVGDKDLWLFADRMCRKTMVPRVGVLLELEALSCLTDVTTLTLLFTVLLGKVSILLWFLLAFDDRDRQQCCGRRGRQGVEAFGWWSQRVFK
jgi:hypothetical protein